MGGSKTNVGKAYFEKYQNGNAKFELHLFDHHVDNVDCFAKDYESNYCVAPTTPAPPTTQPTTQATTKATTQATTKATTKATTQATTQATTKATTPATTKATTKATTTEAPECPSIEEICAKNGDGHFKLCDCYTYTQCWNGGKNNTGKMTCPTGTIWNSVIKNCDWKANVENCAACNCNEAATTTKAPPTTTEPYTGPPTTRPPVSCPDHKSYLSQQGQYIVGDKSGRRIDTNTCTRPSDPLNKPKSPIEEWFTEVKRLTQNDVIMIT